MKRVKIMGLVMGFIAAVMISSMSMSAMAQEEQSTDVTLTKTQTSVNGSHQGSESGQIVIALPPIADNMIWVGHVTWAASKPVNIVVGHVYNTSAVSNQTVSQFGIPFVLPYGDGVEAFTYVEPDSGNGTPINSSSMDFAGHMLAFHSYQEPFAVTYTVDATAEEVDNAAVDDELGSMACSSTYYKYHTTELCPGPYPGPS